MNRIVLASLILSGGLTSGSAWARTRAIQHPLQRFEQRQPDITLVPAAQGSTSLPWAPAPLPTGVLWTHGSYGNALTVAAGIHRRLLDLGLPNVIRCRRVSESPPLNEINVELPKRRTRVAMLQPQSPAS